MQLELNQRQQLNSKMLLGIKLLQMNSFDLQRYIDEVALENPLLGVSCTPNSISFDAVASYIGAEEEDFSESLYSDILSECLRLHLSKYETALVQLVGLCLNKDGFFEDSFTEISEEFHVPVADLQSALNVIRGMQPTGLGAYYIEDCLCMQLDKLNVPAYYYRIVRELLPLVAQNDYERISAELSENKHNVEKALSVIRKLNPHPGAIYCKRNFNAYIIPDIVVKKSNGRSVSVCTNQQSNLFVDTSYQHFFNSSDLAEIKWYLNEKEKQANDLVCAVNHRNATLLRCAEAIVTLQKDFFISESTSALHVLRLSDISDLLSLSISTVSRAISNKYLEYQYKVYPISFFLKKSASINAQNKYSQLEVKQAIEKLVLAEDTGDPLSDQKICDMLSRQGILISRRTVAKFRSQLGIPTAKNRSFFL